MNEMWLFLSRTYQSWIICLAESSREGSDITWCNLELTVPLWVRIIGIWVPFLLTSCGEACLGPAQLDSSWGFAPGLVLTPGLTIGAMSSSLHPLMLPVIYMTCLHSCIISVGFILPWVFLILLSSRCPNIRNSYFLGKKSGPRNDKKNTHLGAVKMVSYMFLCLKRHHL